MIGLNSIDRSASWYYAVAIVDNEFIVKELIIPANANPVLSSHNKQYVDIVIDEKNQDCTEIWGVVTSYVKQF